MVRFGILNTCRLFRFHYHFQLFVRPSLSFSQVSVLHNMWTFSRYYVTLYIYNKLGVFGTHMLRWPWDRFCSAHQTKAWLLSRRQLRNKYSWQQYKCWLNCSSFSHMNPDNLGLYHYSKLDNKLAIGELNKTME